MSYHQRNIGHLELTALEIRSHLIQLQDEKALAIRTGVAEIPIYITDLNEEIGMWRSLYAIAAVTEMATLRAELFGAQAG